MKVSLATHIINNATDLQTAVNGAIRASGFHDKNLGHPSCVYIRGFDRATIEEETLTDGSKVVNLVFHNSTPAQRRREKS